MSNLQKGKSISISAMRVLAMFMIIAFHSMLFYTGKWWMFGDSTVPMWVNASEFLNTVDLPMFVFIAGYLFGYLYKYKNKYRNKAHFIIGKTRRLMVPYLFWGLFLVFVLPPGNHLGELLTGISHLWFLLMLFEVFLIGICTTGILFRERTLFQWGLLFIGSCFLFCAFHVLSSHHHFLCLHAVLFYLPSFILGVCFASHQLHTRIHSKTAGILLTVALLVLALYVFLCPTLPYFANYAILLLTGYTITVTTFLLLSKTGNYGQRTSAIIAHFDKLSMGIYIFNQIVINAFLTLPGIAAILREHYHIGVPIIFVVGFVIPWFLSMLFNRFECLKWTIG